MGKLMSYETYAYQLGLTRISSPRKITGTHAILVKGQPLTYVANTLEIDKGNLSKACKAIREAKEPEYCHECGQVLPS